MIAEPSFGTLVHNHRARYIAQTGVPPNAIFVSPDMSKQFDELCRDTMRVHYEVPRSQHRVYCEMLVIEAAVPDVVLARILLGD